jgi:hypothetical protein
MTLTLMRRTTMPSTMKTRTTMMTTTTMMSTTTTKLMIVFWLITLITLH